MRPWLLAAALILVPAFAFATPPKPARPGSAFTVEIAGHGVVPVEGIRGLDGAAAGGILTFDKMRVRDAGLQSKLRAAATKGGASAYRVNITVTELAKDMSVIRFVGCTIESVRGLQASSNDLITEVAAFKCPPATP